MNTNACQNQNSPETWFQTPVASADDSLQPCLCVMPTTVSQDQLEWEQSLRASLQQYTNQGNYTEAIAIVTRLLELHPDSANDYNNRGLIYFRNRQFVEALADYNQAIELNPRLDSAYNNRANYYVHQGNLAAALSDYETALDYNPGNLRALINQGITYREMGLYDLALDNFELALFLDKRLQGRIYAERGYTYHVRGDWNCAIADYHRALEILPNKPQHQGYQQQVKARLQQLLNPLSA